MPAGSVTGSSLTLVISIMCFLACLTAGAVYMINQSASAWLKDIASEVTVQVEPPKTATSTRSCSDVTAFLRKARGIARCKRAERRRQRAAAGAVARQTDALKALPVPRLIALELDRAAPPEP